MTLYTGQNNSGSLPIHNEDSDPSLLFSEHDRRSAYMLVNDELPIENDKSQKVIDRLQQVYRANNSVQAKYFLDKLGVLEEIE
ncbi:hypothetical protein KC950_00505 [Candidatus Saccharibacteria bacterium]|nr:hypothetical protein [Candidatus Saccharibacteria bacterium]